MYIKKDHIYHIKIVEYSVNKTKTTNILVHRPTLAKQTPCGNGRVDGSSEANDGGVAELRELHRKVKDTR